MFITSSVLEQEVQRCGCFKEIGLNVKLIKDFHRFNICIGTIITDQLNACTG